MTYPKKTRAEVVAFLKGMDCTIPIPQKARLKRDDRQKLCWHIGVCEMRQLLDYLYDGPPTSDAEQLPRDIFS